MPASDIVVNAPNVRALGGGVKADSRDETSVAIRARLGAVSRP
jgi:hypothetical protein